MKSFAVILLSLGVCILSNPLWAEEPVSTNSKVTASAEGPPSPQYRFDSNPFSVMSHRDIIRNNRMQTSGTVLLGVGLGASIAGVIIVEVNAYGGVGMTGFATIGTGIATMVTGMFLLGFSRPYHGTPVNHRVAAGPVRKGSGIALEYGRNF